MHNTDLNEILERIRGMEGKVLQEIENETKVIPVELLDTAIGLVSIVIDFMDKQDVKKS